MMDDLQARLDLAITEARVKALYRHPGWCGGSRDGCTHWMEEEAALDKYAALVALRARREEISRMPCPAGHDAVCGRQDELDAEAERLLEGA